MASIDGLASGLNTTEIIQQLMQIERQPQLRLQTERKANDAAIEALKGLNTKFLAVKTNAEALNSGTGWRPAKASSTDESVAVATAAAGARPVDLTIEVTRLAAAGSAVSTGSVSAMGDVVAAGPTIEVTKGSDTRTIDVGDGSLSAVVQAINDERMGVTASAVQVAPGEFKLQLTSTTTGADTAVSVADGSFTAGSLGGTRVLREAQDAEMKVGGGADPYTVTRSTNTMSDLLDGVTITLRSEGTTTVAVETDTEAMTASVSSMIETVNGVLADIAAKTAYNVEAGRGAVLTGESMLRGLQNRLLGAFSVGTAVDGTTYSPGHFGLTVERDGTIALDEAKLTAAYEEDPDLVEAALGGGAGLAGRLEELAGTATAPARSSTDVGLITSAISSRERQRTRMDASIESWDNRLELREQALIRQFTALERALGEAQSQGEWLASQLAGLQTNNNSR